MATFEADYIPLSGFSKQLERLLEGYCMEVMVTNTSPELQLHSIKKFAKDLVLLFALHMAEKISSLLRQVLDHPTKVLYDPETEALFLLLFWFLPIYRELLNTASRHRPSRDSELRRSASGLVKTVEEKGSVPVPFGSSCRLGSKSLWRTVQVYLVFTWIRFRRAA